MKKIWIVYYIFLNYIILDVTDVSNTSKSTGLPFSLECHGRAGVLFNILHLNYIAHNFLKNWAIALFTIFWQVFGGEI